VHWQAEHAQAPELQQPSLLEQGVDLLAKAIDEAMAKEPITKNEATDLVRIKLMIQIPSDLIK
jgi:hypothetical protein